MTQDRKYMSADEAERLVNRVSAELSEHIEHVQILATWNDEGFTRTLFVGNGNFHARFGMAHDFIATQNSRTNAFEIADAISIDDNW